MFGTDEGWPSRLLPTPKGWLKIVLFIVVIITVMVAKSAYATSSPVTASVKPIIRLHLPKAPMPFGRRPIIDPKTVILEDVYVRN